MRIVEPDEPRAVRRMQRERIRNSVRPIRRRLDADDLKSERITALKVVNAAVECEQELKGVLRARVGHSYHAMI